MMHELRNQFQLFSIRIITTLLFLSVIPILAQPDSVWTRLFSGGYNDYGHSAQQTTDGGFIVAGSRQAFLSGPSDIWLIKTNADGDTLWTKIIGGGNTEEGYSVKQTPDGGYIVAGIISTGNGEPFIIKTDADGDPIWAREYGKTNFYQTMARDLALTSSGYIMTGERGTEPDGNTDVFVFHIDGTGDTLWHKQYGGADYDRGNSVAQVGDGFVVTGYTGERYLTSHPDVWLLRLDAGGDTLWTRRYGDGQNASVGKCVRPTSDGGFIISGYRGLFGEYVNSDLLLIKTDANGDTLWTRTFLNDKLAKGYAVRETADNGYVVCGTYNNFPNELDVVVLKVDANGNELWMNTLTSPYAERAYDIEQISDGGFIVSGFWGFRQNWTYADMFLMRIEPDVASAVEPLAGDPPSDFKLLDNYPNPFNPVTNVAFAIRNSEWVNLTIYDLSGREVRSLVNDHMAAGNYRVAWDGTDNTGKAMVSGMYFYRLQAGGFVATKKMLLVK